jgi:hypothetical protein
MKQDIRNLFKQNEFSKKKLPALHREEFLEKLKEQSHKKPVKKTPFRLLKVAASIAALIALVIIFQKEDPILLPSSNKVSVEPIDSTLIEFKEPMKNSIVDNTIILKEKEPNINLKRVNPKKKIYNRLVIPTKTKIALVKTKVLNKPEIKLTDTLISSFAEVKKETPKSVKVNVDALLFSITHSNSEVLAYYKENNLLRESVLAGLETELKASNLVVNADTLLTEIELGVSKISFKEKLLAAIKVKIKELSNALATN